jgi:hypothetical protein
LLQHVYREKLDIEKRESARRKVGSGELWFL